MRTMIISEFIQELRQKKIEISFSDGKLKYSGPEENITPELINKLKDNKGKLIKYFWPKELDNLMPINPDGTKIPLFIVHGDSGNYIISDYLGPDQPVYGFFHPGSEGEAIRYNSVNEMVNSYLGKVLNVYPTGPFYLIGYSFGGLLAFEMACQLQKQGHKIPFLILIDSYSPLAKESIIWEKTLFGVIRKNILGPLRRKLRDNIKLLKCMYYILMHKPIPIEPRKFYMYYKYLKLAKKHSPSKFSGNLLLFRTTENPSSHKYLGWETLANGIKIIEIFGKHLDVFIGKNRTDILQKGIKEYLDYVNK